MKKLYIYQNTNVLPTSSLSEGTVVGRGEGFKLVGTVEESVDEMLERFSDESQHYEERFYNFCSTWGDAKAYVHRWFRGGLKNKDVFLAATEPLAPDVLAFFS